MKTGFASTAALVAGAFLSFWATVAATPASAQVAVDAQAYCRARHPGSIGRVDHQMREPRIRCNVPGSTGFNGGPVYYPVADACETQTGDPAYIIDSGVWCQTNPHTLASLVGTWRLMSALYIVNRHECGGARYHSTIRITSRTGTNTYTGVNEFHWDLSRLNRACRFRVPPNGRVTVQVTVNGNNTVTIRYRSNGVHTFADDHLMLTDGPDVHVMQGRDDAGQWVVYRKTG